MKPAPSLPLLFLSTIKKLPPQPSSFYTPRRTSNFVVRYFMFDFRRDFPRFLSRISDKIAILCWISDAIFLKSKIKSRKSNTISLQKLPKSLRVGSKSQCKRPAKFQTAVFMCRFPCPGMLLYRETAHLPLSACLLTTNRVFPPLDGSRQHKQQMT